jgi:hypothetical protein
MVPRQRRSLRREPADFHARVVDLRKEGHTVYRTGRGTGAIIDGKRIQPGGIWAKPAVPGPWRGRRRRK